MFDNKNVFDAAITPAVT